MPKQRRIAKCARPSGAEGFQTCRDYRRVSEISKCVSMAPSSDRIGRVEDRAAINPPLGRGGSPRRTWRHFIYSRIAKEPVAVSGFSRVFQHIMHLSAYFLRHHRHRRRPAVAASHCLAKACVVLLALPSNFMPVLSIFETSPQVLTPKWDPPVSAVMHVY